MDGSCPNDDWRVQSLAVKAAPLSPSATCAEVRRLLWQNPAQSLVAVVDGDRPVGMIVRSDLFSTMARPYYPELYDRRPISDLMMRHPSSSTPIATSTNSARSSTPTGPTNTPSASSLPRRDAIAASARRSACSA
jgi:hypothetical protein